MFEKFMSNNAENFRQRYEGTYGFFRNQTGKRLLVKLNTISDHRVDFEDAHGITYHLSADSENNIGFEFIPPASGWYNTPEGAVFMQRVAARQFHRGVTAKNINLFTLHSGLLTEKRLTFDLLSSMYETGITPAEAISSNMKKGSVALSRQFAIDTTKKLIYLLSEGIGSYVHDEKLHFTCKLAQPDLFKTELGETLTALGCASEFV